MLAALVAGLGGLGLALAVLPFQLDDAFITHRYAANVLAGHGPTFEPAAAPAEGFSSPLWLALDLAAGAFFGVEAIPRAASVAGCLALLLSMAALAAVTDQTRRPAPWIACLLLAISGPVAYHTATGLETLAFVALTLVAVAGLTGRVPLWLGAAAAMGGPLCRPEGMWIPVALAAALTVVRERDVIRRGAILATAAAGSALALLVVRRAVFEEWLPNTYFAKPPDRLEGLRYLLDGLLDPWALPLLALAVIGAAVGGKWPRAWLAVALAWALAAVLEGGDWMPAGRFLLPCYAALAVAAAGSSALLTGSRRPRLIVLPLIMLCIGGGALEASRVVGLADASLRTIRHEDRRIEEWLAEAGADSVAQIDIGEIGFRGTLEITDLGGLTDPVIGRAPGGRLAKRFDLDYLFDERAPDAIVLRLEREPPLDPGCEGTVAAEDLRASVERRVHGGPRLGRDYRLHRALIPDYGRTPLYGRLLYLRRDSGIPPPAGDCRVSVAPRKR